MEIVDISLPIRRSLAVWPGDTPYELRWNLRMDAGATVNLSTVTLSVHTGSHADAPLHFVPDGAGIDASDLNVYFGSARVVDLSGCTAIRLDDVRRVDLAGISRVLFKTLGWTDHSTFPLAVPVMEPDVPAFLQSQGVVLVGVDVPSVDEIESKDLPIHHLLLKYGISILESLDLRAVTEGVYELVALPLRLEGVDGSPVRAILRR